MLRKLDRHMQKMKIGYYLTSYTKTNSKWTKDLNVRPETIKLIEEILSINILDISFINDFLDVMPKAKINKWVCIKWNCSHATKKDINKFKSQPTEWHKVANHTYDMGLIVKYTMNSNNSIKKSINSIKYPWLIHVDVWQNPPQYCN